MEGFVGFYDVLEAAQQATSKKQLSSTSTSASVPYSTAINFLMGLVAFVALNCEIGSL
jgi:hypothetical protein